jgi:ketosteroid isomerase-like protein
MNEDQLAALEKRVRRLEDIEAIRTLRMRYHYFINEGMFDRMPELFTADAVVDFGYIAKAEGRDEIAEMYLKIPRNAQLVKQFIHNHMVEVDGDRGTGVSYLDARYAQNGESLIVATKFDEVYARTAEGWRIARMEIEMYFSVPITQGWAATELHHVKAWD